MKLLSVITHDEDPSLARKHNRFDSNIKTFQLSQSSYCSTIYYGTAPAHWQMDIYIE